MKLKKDSSTEVTKSTKVMNYVFGVIVAFVLILGVSYGMMSMSSSDSSDNYEYSTKSSDSPF